MKHVKGMTRYDTISEDTDACLHVRGVSQETMNLAMTMKDMKSLNQLRKKNRKKQTIHETQLERTEAKKYPPERCGSGHDCLDLCVFQFVFDIFLVNQKNKTSDFRQGFCFCLFLGCPFYFDFLVS